MFELQGIEVEELPFDQGIGGGLKQFHPGDHFPSEVWAEMDGDPLEDAHEAHGGDESPDPEGCPICEKTINDFIRYGFSI